MVVGEGRSEQDELVAADAGKGVGRVDGFTEVLGYLAEDLVAGLVAVGVIDFLEAVEVEQEHGHGCASAAAAVERVRKSLFEEAAVGQAGEFVVEGEPLVAGDLLLEHDKD